MLSYAERERLLEELAELGANADPAATVSLANDRLLGSDTPRAAAELLAENIAALSAMATAENRDSTALGALAFVAKTPSADLGAAPTASACILATEIALNAAAERGEAQGYLPAPLQEEVRDFALALFEEYSAPEPTAELAASARATIESLENLRGPGFYGRMLANADFLLGLLSDPKADEKGLSAAVGALTYLVDPTDALHDNLGLLGIVDDAVVLEEAARIADPARLPWLDVFEKLHAAWPFLSGVAFGDRTEGFCPMPEYWLANAALTSADLVEHPDADTAIVLPRVGPIPLLLATLHAIAMLHGQVASAVAESSPFTNGETVRIDNAGTAHFLGLDEVDDRPYVKLRCWPPKNQPPVTRYLPIAVLSRLAPAPAEERPRGPIPRERELGDGQISGLERIFGLPGPVHFRAQPPAVVLVGPIGRNRALADKLMVRGDRLVDLCPMGSWNAIDQEWRLFSKRFPVDAPLVGFVSDLDDAVEVLSDLPGGETVIVDTTGANGGRQHALRRIRDTGRRVIAVAEENDERASEHLETAGYRFWDWSPATLRQLTWEHGGYPRVVRENLRATARSAHAKPEVVEIPLPGAKSVFNMLGQARREFPPADAPASWQDAYMAATQIFLALIRGLGPVDDQQSQLDDRLGLLSEDQTTRGLNKGEREALAELSTGLMTLREEVVGARAREAAARRLLREADWQIAAPDAASIPGIAGRLGVSTSRVIPLQRAPEPDTRGLLILGWPNRKMVGRLLYPPVANRTALLLYDLEADWYRRDLHRRIRRQAGRQAQQGQHIREAPRPRVSAAAVAPEPPAAEAIELVNEDVRRRLIRAAAGRTRQDEVEALIVWFEEDLHTFYLADHPVPCVTHLVDGDADPSDSAVLEKRAQELVMGDVILVLADSDRNVLREEADRLLAPGTRDLSRLWQRTLRDHYTEHGFDVLVRALRGAGCARYEATIDRWLSDDAMLAPQANEDVASIAQATQPSELSRRLEECLDAIRQVRGAHIKAAHQLGAAVLEAWASAVASGRDLPSLESHASRASLLRVLEVDNGPFRVDRAALNTTRSSFDL